MLFETLFIAVYCNILESLNISSDLVCSYVMLVLWPETDYTQEDNKHKHWSLDKGNEKQKHPMESKWVQDMTSIKKQGFVAV